MGGLRLLLAVSVVLSHAPPQLLPTLYPGNMAVEMFFIISGFYMALILTERYHTHSTRGVARFYASRFFRLWPVLLIATLAAQAWWLAGYAHLGRAPSSAAPFRAWIGNDWLYGAIRLAGYLMVGLDVPSLAHVAPATGVRLTLGPAHTLPDGAVWLGYVRDIGPAWTLGTEIWFYLLAPFLLRLASGWLMAIALASLALRAGLWSAGLETYFFFPAQLALFLLGCLGFRVSRAGGFASRRAGLSCVVLAAGAALVFGSPGGLGQAWKWALYGAFALTIGALFATTRASPADRLLGELSYPVYITHALVGAVLATLGKRFGVEPGGEVLLVAVLPLAVGLHVAIERPVTAWRQRFAAGGAAARRGAAAGVG